MLTAVFSLPKIESFLWSKLSTDGPLVCSEFLSILSLEEIRYNLTTAHHTFFEATDFDSIDFHTQRLFVHNLFCSPAATTHAFKTSECIKAHSKSDENDVRVANRGALHSLFYYALVLCIQIFNELFQTTICMQ